MKKLQKWISLLLVLAMIVCLTPMAIANENELPDDRDDGGSGAPELPEDEWDDPIGGGNELPDDRDDPEDEGNIIASGFCGGEGDGTNLRWTLYTDGTLTITGSGKMADYRQDAPWYGRRYNVRKVVIADGVTTIGNFAFFDCQLMTEISIPPSMTSVGELAFVSCENLTSIIFPARLEMIGYHSFIYCDKLRAVYFEGNAPLEDEACFEKVTTLYYIIGKTGWTDSEYYDAEAGTWNGYKLAVWEKNKVELTEQDGEIEIKVVADEPATAMVATYNENGKFIKCVEKEIQPGETTWTVAAADLLRVFLLDDDHAPLGTPAEYPAK